MSQSVSAYIRDQMYSRLKGIAPWVVTRTSPGPTLQTGDLPALGVYLMREQYVADGDENVLSPRYVVDAVYSVNVIAQATNMAGADTSSDSLIDQCLEALLTDGTFVSLKWTDGETIIIESIPSISRSYQFPQTGESYFVEVRLQITIRYRVSFDPLAPNALTDVAVSTQPFDGSVQSGDYTTDIQPPQ